MRKPLIHTHCHLICCVYIKGHVSIHIVWCWRCWDTWIQMIKAMSKVSKILYRFQCFKCYVCWRHQRWCLWLFTQHCIQSNVTHRTHIRSVEDVKYYVLCIQGLSLLPGGKAIWAFHLGGLVVHYQSVWGGSFVNFLRLVIYKGDCRQDAQPIPNS